MSAGLYDAAMVAADRLWDHRERLIASSDPIKAGLDRQLSDETKIPFLTGKTSTAQSVKDRIALMESIMREGSGL